MAIHRGEAEPRDDDFFGPALNRCARLLDTGWGGQILISGAAEEGLSDVDLLDLGDHVLKDLSTPVHVYQVLAGDLPHDFSSLRSLSTFTNNLPIQLTSVFGREREIAELSARLGSNRLVTLFGPGGVGKSRLALQIASESLDRYRHGVCSSTSPPYRPAAKLQVPSPRSSGFRMSPAEMLRQRSSRPAELAALGDDQYLVADVSYMTGRAFLHGGEIERAAVELTEAHRLAAAIGDPWLTAWIQLFLAEALRDEDLDAARQYLDDDAPIVETLGDPSAQGLLAESRGQSRPPSRRHEKRRRGTGKGPASHDRHRKPC
jgi:hypothetical protein